MYYTGFFCGASVGVFVGFILCALLAMSKECDERTQFPPSQDEGSKK